jgi:hypothetical protein
MATAVSVALSDDERRVVVTALNMLSKSMIRAAKASVSKEIADLHERDSARVDALAIKFR